MPLLLHWSLASKRAIRFIRHSNGSYSHTVLTGSLLCVLISTTSTSSQALEFQCESPGITRNLSVDIPGEEHLCEVAVTDAQSGVRDVKWYANNDTLFCSARAYEMRDKYEQLWNFTCSKWPDLNGIDVLSPSQRLILDQRLKALVAQGSEAQPSFTITGLRAVASTPLNEVAGKLAFQFFKNEAGGIATDFTEVIDDKVQSWRVSATIDSLISQVDDVTPGGAVLINAIDADGELRVHSTFTNAENSLCYGSQTLNSTDGNGTVTASSPHRFLCRSDSLDPATLSGVQPEKEPQPQPRQ